MSAAAAGERRIVVVGASAAGLRCACRLARLRPSWQIDVIERRTDFSFAACGLPYALSGDIGDARALRTTADGAVRDAAYFRSVKGIAVHAGCEALTIDCSARSLRVHTADGEETLPWDDLVIATGARPLRLPGQPADPRIHTLHTIEDPESLQRGLASGSIARVGIVGAGVLGCELAESFRALWGADVTLFEAARHPLPKLLDPDHGSIVAAALRSHGVDLRLSSRIQHLEPLREGVAVVAGGVRSVFDAILVAAGVEPVVGLARRAGVGLGPTGAIAVDRRLATSVPGIWAAGDCVEVEHAVTGAPVYLPLGSLANRQGRTLAAVLAGRDACFPAVAGAAAVKVFDCNVATTGCTLSAAREARIPARAVWITAHDRPHYWPESAELAIQLVYQPATRRVLGVQAAGSGEVAKRIDVATQLIARGATIDELADLEHAYAPPYAPAIEPLAVAAMAAQNQEDGIEARAPLSPLEGLELVDVRHEEERAARPVLEAEAAPLPLEELRRAHVQTDGHEVVTVCERGSRAAEAARLLSSSYLGGGLRWRDGLIWRDGR